MNPKLRSILVLLLFCASCACYDKVNYREKTFPTDSPYQQTPAEGIVIALERGYDDDFVEIYADGELVFSKRITTFYAVDAADGVELENQDRPISVEIHFPEHQRKYRFRIDPENGPCVGVSWDGEQLDVSHYNIFPIYE